jgi:hypothetical protein
LELLISYVSKACGNVEIKDPGHKYDSLEEAAGHIGSRAERLFISGWGPYIDIAVGFRRLSWFYTDETNHVYAETATDTGDALFLRVRDLLTKRQRVLSLFFNMWSFWLVLLLYWPISYLESHSSLPSVEKHFIDISLPLIQLGYLLCYGILQRRGFTQIILESKINKTSFWSRNSDDIIKLVIGGIIGALLALLGAYITYRFK